MDEESFPFDAGALRDQAHTGEPRLRPLRHLLGRRADRLRPLGAHVNNSNPDTPAWLSGFGIFPVPAQVLRPCCPGEFSRAAMSIRTAKTTCMCWLPGQVKSGDRHAVIAFSRMARSDPTRPPILASHSQKLPLRCRRWRYRNSILSLTPVGHEQARMPEHFIGPCASRANSIFQFFSVRLAANGRQGYWLRCPLDA